jgi:aldehyde dehydrogenase (NAD+)
MQIALPSSPSRELPAAQLQIGDQLLESASGGTYEHINPATGEVQATVPLAGAKEVDEAVAAARRAFKSWRSTPAAHRRVLLNRLAALIAENSAEFARLCALENGTVYSGAPIMPHLASEWTSYYAGWADKIDGQVNSSFPGDQFAYTLPEPYGVIGIIITWNGPLISLGMKVAPALAAGNTVVVKPSELTPWAAGLFGRLVLEAGIPPGVVNILTGSVEAGDALVRHPDVEKISFTGGPATAGRIQAAGAQLLKPMIFELGGKSGNLLFADADLDRAVAEALQYSIVLMSGQGCAFPTRLLVERPVYTQVVESIATQVNALVVGDPFDPKTQLGPVVNAAARDRISNFITVSRERGDGRLVAGGTLPQDLAHSKGFYVPPTVFADVDHRSDLAQQEIFGPVLCITPFADEQEAVSIANSTDYGLASYIQTSDLSRTLRLASELRSGNVYVNGAMAIQPASPFGGERMSGYGREGGRAGLEEFVRLKTVAIANIGR